MSRSQPTILWVWSIERELKNIRIQTPIILWASLIKNKLYTERIAHDLQKFCDKRASMLYAPGNISCGLLTVAAHHGKMIAHQENHACPKPYGALKQCMVSSSAVVAWITPASKAGSHDSVTASKHSSLSRLLQAGKVSARRWRTSPAAKQLTQARASASKTTPVFSGPLGRAALQNLFAASWHPMLRSLWSVINLHRASYLCMWYHSTGTEKCSFGQHATLIPLGQERLATPHMETGGPGGESSSSAEFVAS